MRRQGAQDQGLGRPAPTARAGPGMALDGREKLDCGLQNGRVALFPRGDYSSGPGSGVGGGFGLSAATPTAAGAAAPSGEGVAGTPSSRGAPSATCISELGCRMGATETIECL